MNQSTGVTLRWPVAIIAVITLVGLGAGVTYLGMRRTVSNMRPQDVAPGGVAPAVPSAASQAGTTSTDAAHRSPPDVVVSLSADVMKRAGIEIAVVKTGVATSAVRIPATVEPNAYKQVVVTPLVAGRVTRMLVQLGDHVRRGQPLAEVFSPELADAQTRYVSTKADLQAHERELDRTAKLVEIGAASRQELEQLHAEHADKVASLQSLRSRLVLLGMPASAIDSLSPGSGVDPTVSIHAPIAGVITERNANIGLNVDATTKLVTVVDLSSVWVVGALYERDFPRVQTGAAATVATAAYPDSTWGGRVTYIDPQVNPDTRTARVRVEVPNPKENLRLGMFANIDILGTTNREAILIPRGAVQTVGDRQVVYVASPNDPGKFVERDVRIGATSGDTIEVASGLKPGEQIVSNGSFYLRAERDRLGMAGAAHGAHSGADAAPPASSITPKVQSARITVGQQGFAPARVTLRAGVLAQLTFTRVSNETCAAEVVFPSLNLRRPLPLNQPVIIEFTPTSGEIAFACGMNMLHGTVVAQ